MHLMLAREGFILGRQVDEWLKLGKLYEYIKGVKPKDLFELDLFAHENRAKTVDDCLRIAAAWGQCFDKDDSYTRKIIKRYLQCNPYEVNK